MILAYDYPMAGVLWSIFFFVMWVVWIMLLFHVIGDVIRSRDLRGIAKAVWLLWILFLPFIGVLAYVLVRGDLMTTPAMQARSANEAASEGYLHLRG